MGLATSLLAVLPANVGDLPTYGQELRLVAIPLVIFGVRSVGVSALEQIVKFIEQSTWSAYRVLQEEHLKRAAESWSMALNIKEQREGGNFQFVA